MGFVKDSSKTVIKEKSPMYVGNTEQLPAATQPATPAATQENAVQQISEKLAESKIIFIFQDGTRKANIEFKYDREWYYQLDSFARVPWNKVTNLGPISDTQNRIISWSYGFIFGQGYDHDAVVDYIKKFQRKSFIEGLNLLITRTLANNEGGWVSNTALVTDKVTLEGKTGRVIVRASNYVVAFIFTDSNWTLQLLDGGPYISDYFYALLGKIKNMNKEDGILVLFGENLNS